MPPACLTLGQVNRWVAMLDGYLGRATDGPSGAETLPPGWRLRAAAAG